MIPSAFTVVPCKPQYHCTVLSIETWGKDNLKGVRDRCMQVLKKQQELSSCSLSCWLSFQQSQKSELWHDTHIYIVSVIKMSLSRHWESTAIELLRNHRNKDAPCCCRTWDSSHFEVFCLDIHPTLHTGAAESSVRRLFMVPNLPKCKQINVSS